MKTTGLLMTIALAFAGGAAIAQNTATMPPPTTQGPTQEATPSASVPTEQVSRPRGAMIAGLQKACASDFATLCPGMHLGDGKLGPCMRANMAKLSPVCASAVKSLRAARQGGQ